MQQLQDRAYHQYLLRPDMEQLQKDFDRSAPQLYAWLAAARKRQVERLREQDGLNGVERQLAGMRFAQEEAIDGWLRSKKAKTRKTSKVEVKAYEVEPGGDDLPVKRTATTTQDEQVGDSRFLTILLQAMGDERKLLGIDARRVRELLSSAIGNEVSPDEFESLDVRSLLTLIESKTGTGGR